MKKLLFICLLLVFACNQVPQYRDVKIWQDYPDGYIGPRFDDAARYTVENITNDTLNFVMVSNKQDTMLTSIILPKASFVMYYTCYLVITPKNQVSYIVAPYNFY
jgi:hypothetical protein